MTIVEKQRYLSRYRSLERQITRETEELVRWRSLAEKITPSVSDTPRARRDGSRVEYAVEKIIVWEERLNGHLAELIELRGEIERAVLKLDDERCQRLLVLRYIDGLTWVAISDEMGYEPDGNYVFRLHRKALSMLEI